MKLHHYIPNVILLAVLCLAGCEKENDGKLEEATGELHLSAFIEGMAPDEATSRFRAAQGVGMWLSAVRTDADLNRADIARNTRFMQSAGGLVSDPRICWNHQPSLELYAYAPYDEKAGENPAAYAFVIDPRQDSLALHQEEYEKNDLLYARQTVKYSDEATILSFRHLMSKIVLHIHSNSSTPGSLVGSRVTVGNVMLNASVDLGNGVVTAKGDAGRVVSAACEELPAGIEIMREAIVVPQKIAVGTQLLEILTPGHYTYTWNTDQELNFESGKQIVLDVLIEENECEVRIKEIAPWRDQETILGEALKDLPTYHMFDYYNERGIRGIVIGLDETGKHGWIVSLDETEGYWCTNPGQGIGNFPEAVNDDDARANLEAVRLLDPALADYPAFKWCEDKNVDGVTGWVLPAYNVLKLFGDAVIKDEDGNKAFNAAIRNVPEAVEKKEVVIDRGNSDTYFNYYSSTLGSLWSGQVKCCGWNGANSWWGDPYVEEVNMPQEGEGYWDDVIGDVAYLPLRIRAFHEF